MALTTLTKQGCFDNDLELQVNSNIAALDTALGKAATNTTAPTGTGGVVLATSPTLVTPALGTPSAIVLTNATGLPAGTGLTAGSVTSTQLDPTTIQYLSVPLTLAQIIASHSVPIVIAGLAAKGAGTLIEITSALLDLVYGSAAFVGGGACALYYGTDATGVIAQTAFAATVFTTFSASHCIVAGGALAVNASSAVLNTGLVFANPTADFTVGTGASGILKIAYRVHSGLS